MSKPLQIIVWTLGIAVLIAVLLFAWSSFLGLLMALMLVFAIVDFTTRRRRQAVQSFNGAVRAVCQHEGAIGKVALAFSRSGPLSGPCYEYSRRLMMGEDPVDAAVDAHVPLQLRTVIAMQSPPAIPQSEGSPQSDAAGHIPAAEESFPDESDYELAMVDATMMPAYGQFLYLIATAMVTCVVLGFMGVFIVPTLEAMFDEFGLQKMPYRFLFSSAPALWILFLLLFIVVIIVPLLNRGHLAGIALPQWIPTLPRPAERKSELLHGLADGIDAGWPLGRVLATGHSVSAQASERRSFESAMRLIERGTQPIEAMRRIGWIDRNEASWLADATPQRTAELLRTIGDQGVRDARSNLRWMMAVIYPVLILLLGASVLAYAVGFFATLSRLISGLS